jgi:phosphoglycolate phosphatase-like HAD superfamily hydrolase
MIAEIAACNAAFQVIKTAVKNSGEIIEAGQAVYDYFNNKEAVQKKIKETPPSKRNLLKEFFELEKLKKQEQELKELMIYQGRPGLWDDWLEFQKRARQQREAEERQKIKEELERKQKRQKIVEKVMLTLWLSVLVVCICALAATGVYILLEAR